MTIIRALVDIKQLRFCGHFNEYTRTYMSILEDTKLKSQEYNNGYNL